MNDAQVWSIIGVLAATLVSTIIGFFTLFLRTMKAQFETMHVEIVGLRNEMGSRFDAVNDKFDAVNDKFDAVNAKFDARFDTVNARLDATDHRIDGIDRDIQLTFSKVFGSGGERI